MRILVATDGSRAALHAVKYAVKLIGQLSSQSSSVTLISVHDNAGLRHARAFVGRSVVADYLRELSEKELRPARRVLDAARVEHDMVVRTGHVAAEIVALARSGKYDLLVLGAKGRNPVGDLVLGSVARRVLAIAPIPVLLVK